MAYDRQSVVGQQYSLLTCEEYLYDTKGGHAKYLWRCTCGGTIEAYKGNVVSGQTIQCKSCSSKSKSARMEGNVLGTNTATHGRSKSPIYACWASMKHRCDNPNHPEYHRYGGRGIRYCAAWTNFETFLADMESTYFESATLDKIDNDADYSKDNCQWLTRSENSVKRWKNEN